MRRIAYILIWTAFLSALVIFMYSFRPPPEAAGAVGLPTRNPTAPVRPNPVWGGAAPPTFVASNAVAGPDLSLTPGQGSDGLEGSVVCDANVGHTGHPMCFTQSYTDGAGEACYVDQGSAGFTSGNCFVRSVAAKGARATALPTYAAGSAVGFFGVDYDQAFDLLYYGGLGLDTQGTDDVPVACNLANAGNVTTAFQNVGNCTGFDVNAGLGTSPWPGVTAYPVVNQKTHEVYFVPAGGQSLPQHLPNGVGYVFDGSSYANFGNAAHWNIFDTTTKDAHAKGFQFGVICNGVLAEIPFAIAGGYWAFYNTATGSTGYNNGANWVVFQDPNQVSGYTGEVCGPDNAVYAVQFSASTGHKVTRVDLSSGWNAGTPVSNGSFKVLDFQNGVPGYVDPGAWQAAYADGTNIFITGNQSNNVCELPNAGASTFQTPTAWTCYQTTTMSGMTNRGGFSGGFYCLANVGRCFSSGYGSNTAVGGIQWYSIPAAGNTTN